MASQITQAETVIVAYFVYKTATKNTTKFQFNSMHLYK